MIAARCDTINDNVNIDCRESAHEHSCPLALREKESMTQSTVQHVQLPSLFFDWRATDEENTPAIIPTPIARLHAHTHDVSINVAP